jgi:membrane fusion protein (multidrug efflux system)
MVSDTRAAALMLTAAAFLACGKKEEPAKPPPPEVPVQPVAQRDVELKSEYVAQLAGMEDVEIRARVQGYLASIEYREGSEVKKDQPLFQIDVQSLEEAVSQAEAQLAKARADLAKSQQDVSRYAPLVAKNAIPKQDLDNARSSVRMGKAQVESSEANLRRAKVNLGYASITSPIDGLAGVAQRKVGDLVGRGESTLLTTVSSIDPIRATIFISESDYLRFAAPISQQQRADQQKPAEPLAVQLILGNGQEFAHTGKVVLVDRAVDPKTSTLRVDFAFPNPEHTLRPGLFSRVRLRTELLKNALLVPQKAVRELQDLTTVAVVGPEDKVQTRKVKTGAKIGTDWIITEGLKPGDRVVLSDIEALKDGTQVKPVQPQPSPQAQQQQQQEQQEQQAPQGEPGQQPAPPKEGPGQQPPQPPVGRRPEPPPRK